ncbi:pseudouridine synthase [Tundrisphaera lichenicola]|uniref:pseudouridine synthase n=1 Tax=Tundrisphaera lichenicola TaxID=2029860 RepID=UPI003EBF7D9C
MAPQRPPRRGNNSPRGPKAHAGGPPRREGSAPRRPGGSNQGPRPGSSSQGRRPGGPTVPRRPSSSSPSTTRPIQAGDSSGPERLQKILAHAGVGSRRACEELILQGRVTIGGKVVKELGTKVDPAREPVAVDGQKVQIERPVYFAVYKPKGYVSTNDDPSGRPRVLDLLPEIPQRVYTVGRLDEMSVGLMLLTNDGDLANKLAHPKFGVEKLYRVTVAGSPPREVLTQLTEGIWLAEGKVRAKRVRAIGKRGDSTILELVLAEGKNREVRRMLAKLGHKVMTLTRVAVGPITVKGLSAGQFRPLTGREVDLLRRVAAGQPVSMPWMTDRGPRREAPRPRRPEGSAPPEHRPGPRDSDGPRAAFRGRAGESPTPPPRNFDGPRHRPPVRPGEVRHPGLPPSARTNQGRGPGPRPQDRPNEGYRPGPRAQDRPNEGYRPGPRSQDRPGRGDRPGTRPPQRHSAEGRGPGPRPQGAPGDGPRRGPGDRGPRPSSGLRPYVEEGNERQGRPQQHGPRPSRGGPGVGQNSGPRPPRPRLGPVPEGKPNGPRGRGPVGEGPSTPRRSSSPPPQDLPRRKVIGMDSAPGPVSDDRPKPQMKRPVNNARKPPPRPSFGSKPKPRRRVDGEGPSE